MLDSDPEPSQITPAGQTQIGQRRESIMALNTLIRREPDNAVHYIRRSEIFLELGSPGQALRDVEKALELNPQIADAWRIKAAIALSDRTVGPVTMPRSKPGMDNKISPEEIAAARADLERALELDPQNVLAHALKGRATRLSGDPRGALDDLRRAEEIDEDQPFVHIEFARTYVELGQWSMAADSYDDAVSLDPNSVDLLMTAAYTHWNIGEFGTAIDLLERAAVLRPGDHNIFSNLAMLYAADEDEEEALYYDSLARRKAAMQNQRYSSPIIVGEDGSVKPGITPSGLEAEAKSMAILEDTDEAEVVTNDEEFAAAPAAEPIPAATSMPSMAPSAPAAEPLRDLMAEARQALDKGNADAALALVSEHFDNAEPTAKDYCFQARVLAALHEQEMASDAARKAIRTDPDDFCGYNNLGVITAASSPRTAIDIFTKGLERMPRVAEMLNERGKLYLNTEQYDKAELDFAACVEIDPNTAIYRLHRAIARYHTGAFEGALEDADKFLIMNPNAPEGYRTRAAIHEKLGNAEQAAKDLEISKSLQAK